MSIRLHILARAIIVSSGHILVARAKDASNTFLPGGHVEPGEGLEATLIRELNEEMGIATSVKRYLGAVEHKWEEAGTKNHEINHCFELEGEGLRYDQAVLSRESHLEFHWLKLSKLEAHNLQPFPLQRLLQTFESGNSTAWWASTL